MTVREIILAICEKQDLKPFPEEQTCDKLVCGNYDQEVTKIATTFMATVDVIKQAASLGIDFIITHEPTWFTGEDSEKAVEDNPVYLKKRQLLEDNNIAVWRYHDHMHMGKDDGIYTGFDRETGWDQYRLPRSDKPETPFEQSGIFYQIPEQSVEEIASFFKQRFHLPVIRVVGDPSMKVRRVGVMVGGGSLGFGQEELPMQAMEKHALDLAVCGDITEWTLSAYVRDASMLGYSKAMIILGHERSEEAGMKHLPAWLKPLVGDMEIVFLDAKEPFCYL